MAMTANDTGGGTTHERGSAGLTPLERGRSGAVGDAAAANGSTATAKQETKKRLRPLTLDPHEQAAATEVHACGIRVNAHGELRAHGAVPHRPPGWGSDQPGSPDDTEAAQRAMPGGPAMPRAMPLAFTRDGVTTSREFTVAVAEVHKLRYKKEWRARRRNVWDQRRENKNERERERERTKEGPPGGGVRGLGWVGRCA